MPSLALRSMVGGLAVVAVLAACAVGPNYRRPDMPVDAHFANAGEPGLAPGDPVERYWTGFADPLLDNLVEDALARNKDLEVAAANLRAARAVRRVVGFDQYPTVTLAGGYTHSLDAQQQLPGVDRHDREFDTAQGSFDGLWELDLFGRVRRNVEAARADVGASEATLRDARVSVIAEVARNYFILRGLQDQLVLTERNAGNQLSTAKLTRTRLDAGRGNELDTARAEAQWQTTLASIPTLQASIATTTYRLSVLTGRQPKALDERLTPQAPMPALPVLNAIGTPEQLLRHRPDVRVAERRLAAATARVGVAMGDLFPKVTMVGEVGYLAPTFGDFGQSEARFFSVGPSISWAAFDLGRVSARISSAKAQTGAALAGYEGAVLNALEDAEGAMIVYGRSQSRREALRVAAAASDKAADLARKRFEGGLIDFLEVLDAERTALSAELLLSQSRTDAAVSLVAVYKALGAGWAVSESSGAAAAQR
ncbi:MAG TPA: TolC family protein [Steroidobacteraceae bacterium]|jgi:multidrug efflux system outer membrane protein|nr:TolC family protein [Steroidobacteraceae bacterium]